MLFLEWFLEESDSFPYIADEIRKPLRISSDRCWVESRNNIAAKLFAVVVESSKLCNARQACEGGKSDRSQRENHFRFCCVNFFDQSRPTTFDGICRRGLPPAENCISDVRFLRIEVELIESPPEDFSRKTDKGSACSNLFPTGRLSYDDKTSRLPCTRNEFSTITQ